MLNDTMRALPETAGGSTEGAVIPSLSFEALLAQREAAVAALTAIAKAMADYHAVGAAVFEAEDSPHRYNPAPYKFREPLDHRPHGHGMYLSDEKWLAHSIASIDASLWDHLLDRSGLRTFMDAEARKEWGEQIERNETPPLTRENVAATFRELHSKRGEFFERGVLKVFRDLSWHYKTNRPCKFGKKLILTYVMSSGYPNEHRANALADLERAFHVLDGKPEPDHRASISGLLYRSRRGPDGTDDVVTPYLRVRTFKNGNGHVYLLRQDLVDELNLILAKHYPDALPPALEAA